MAKINHTVYDRTLALVGKAMEEESKLDEPRNYLGMSQIGDECWRKLFYSYRKAAQRNMTAGSLRAIQDGHLQETVMSSRFSMVPSIELITHTKDGSQIGFKLLLDHFRGHADGVISGIEEAPKTVHIWEHKSVNEKKFKELEKLRQEHGEKYALEIWDIVYYAQGQIYMHCAQLTRHYLTVSTPGGREYISIRTDYNKKYAESLIDKAKTIIFDNWTSPARLSEKREFYKCKWCDFSGICHDNEVPDLNCRTCRYCEPVNGGQFNCLDKEKILKNFNPCRHHIYNPALLNATLKEHIEDGCIYESNGVTWTNCGDGYFPSDASIDSFFTSKELKEKIKNLDDIKLEILKVQKAFNGEIDHRSPEIKAWERFK